MRAVSESEAKASKERLLEWAKATKTRQAATWVNGFLRGIRKRNIFHR